MYVHLKHYSELHSTAKSWENLGFITMGREQQDVFVTIHDTTYIMSELLFTNYMRMRSGSLGLALMGIEE